MKCIQNIVVSYSVASILLLCGSSSSASLTGDPEGIEENLETLEIRSLYEGRYFTNFCRTCFPLTFFFLFC